jgi:nucleoid-associated protein YgaU
VTLTLALAGAAWAGPALGALAGGAEPAPVARSSYVVRPGDTLWSIARRLEPGEDPRAVVDEIAEANRIAAGDLVPGQVLVLPSA